MRKGLSVQMVRALINLREGKSTGHHLRGQSEHGAHTGTVASLHKRGLIESIRGGIGGTQLTAAGIAEIRCHAKENGECTWAHCRKGWGPVAAGDQCWLQTLDEANK